MIYFVDIDNTICFTNGMDYENSVPNKEMITYINSLFETGNTVIYWTSRGVMSGNDYREITEKQLESWGCKYNELRLDKPYFDCMIDDKVINVKNINHE